MDTRPLQGQVAIVTGSSRGIGRSIAILMAQAGASVVINGTRQEHVDSTVEEITRLGEAAIGVCESVATVQGGERIIQRALDHFGKLDILVNNAGIVRDNLAYRMEETEWDEVIAVHLKGAFACSKPAILHMKERGNGGCILMMTSLAGLQGTIGQLNYSAAKAGMVGMTWTLAQELQRYRIRVNAIAPAAETDMTRPHIQRAIERARSQGKEVDSYWQVGQPEAVARLALALCLEESREVTGKIYSVNGGRLGEWTAPSHVSYSANLNEEKTPDEIVQQVLIPSLYADKK